MPDEKLWLRKLLGQEIEVHYLNQGFKDKGHLTQIDDNWIEIYTGTGEHLLIPSCAVRLVKVLAKKDAPENKLLRPAKKADDDSIEEHNK
ncbi:MAG: hypothetical protein ABJA67_18030 [Chthonomonadales bacterium]